MGLFDSIKAMFAKKPGVETPAEMPQESPAPEAPAEEVMTLETPAEEEKMSGAGEAPAMETPSEEKSEEGM